MRILRGSRVAPVGWLNSLPDMNLCRGQFIDGAFTLGENIGDLGGVEVALSAYRLSLDGRPAPVIDGYTGEQRFFLAYAQVWRVHRRDDLALQLLKSDSHSPPKISD